MRISDWSSDVCSSDLGAPKAPAKPFPPISSGDVAWNDEGPPASTRFGGRSKHLTSAAVGENYHVGLLIESPAPGKRLAPRHHHMLEEEHALIDRKSVV